jgi:hypothetical protein
VVLDVQLGVGGLSDVMTVTADASLLRKANAEVGTNMTSRIVTNLPLNITGGRRSRTSPTHHAQRRRQQLGVEHRGRRAVSKEVVIDGTSAVIQIQGHISESSPPMEAVEEFKVQTSGIPAEYGRTGGGVFNFSLRRAPTSSGAAPTASSATRRSTPTRG